MKAAQWDAGQFVQTGRRGRLRGRTIAVSACPRRAAGLRPEHPAGPGDCDRRRQIPGSRATHLRRHGPRQVQGRPSWCQAFLRRVSRLGLIPPSHTPNVTAIHLLRRCPFAHSGHIRLWCEKISLLQVPVEPAVAGLAAPAYLAIGCLRHAVFAPRISIRLLGCCNIHCIQQYTNAC